MLFGYNEYMAHHYAYMTRVAEMREPESYVEVAKDANWRAAMEEETIQTNRLQLFYVEVEDEGHARG